MTINNSYETLMSNRNLLNFKSENLEHTPKRKPNHEFDINKDGKFSKKEYQALKKHRLEESARAFYNLHETLLFQ